MAFDATMPADRAPLVAAQMREQLNALKAEIDDLRAEMQQQLTEKQSQIDGLTGQMGSIAAAAGSAQNMVSDLSNRLNGSWTFQSLCVDGAVAAGTLSSNAYITFGGRWTMNLDGVGNVVLLDTVTGYSTPLTNLPI